MPCVTSATAIPLLDTGENCLMPEPQEPWSSLGYSSYLCTTLFNVNVPDILVGADAGVQPPVVVQCAVGVCKSEAPPWQCSA